MTQEIRSQDWEEFCRRFTEGNAGSLLSIELTGRDGVQKNVARDLPLEKMTMDKTDACNDLITISMASNGSHVSHTIIEPIRLLVKEVKGSKTLQIEAENGVTLVTFHSGRFPEISE
ncbi:MAG: DUF5335 family protein [Verrucomicrobiota bacterium]